MGAATSTELEAALGEVGERLDVVVLRWHFAYGPMSVWAYGYAQEASLNHARLVFPGAKWGAAFDVDEYPRSILQ